VDGLTTPDPQNTFVRPASGVYKSVVALPGKEADFMMFRDVPHGNLIEHQYLNQLTKVARRVVVSTPPDYSTSNKKYPVVYLLHGANDYELGWTQTGMANTIMDNLIADKKAVPAIIVMPFGHEKTGAAGKQPEILALQQALGYTPPPVARGTAPREGGAAAGSAPAGAPPAGAARGAGPGGRAFGISASGWSMEKETLDYVIPYVEKVPRHQRQGSPRDHGLFDGRRSQHLHRLRPSGTVCLRRRVQRIRFHEPGHRRPGEDEQELQDDLPRRGHRGHRG